MNPSELWPRTVLLLYVNPYPSGEFDISFISGFEDNGCRVDCVRNGQSWHNDYDMVIGYGPFTIQQSPFKIGQQLLKMPVQKRPAFVWWLTENIPDPRFPIELTKVAAMLRLLADRLFSSSALKLPLALQQILLRGHRLRVYGELRWLRQKGVLDVLAITSYNRALYYRRSGMDCVEAPLGYHPIYGSDLNLPRDIQVVFLGNMDSERRQQFVPPLFDELRKRDVNVVIKTRIYDEERTEFLNRTCILLNVLRAPQDYVGQRFLLGAANKALVISEPIPGEEPFRPGEHLVTCSLETMADTIGIYLANQQKRQQIVDAAYRFVTQELTIEKSVRRILDKARQCRNKEAG